MTQRHGIYSVPLPISGKKVAANVVTLAAWRSGRDSNPRAIARKLISSVVRLWQIHLWSRSFQAAL